MEILTAVGDRTPTVNNRLISPTHQEVHWEAAAGFQAGA